MLARDLKSAFWATAIVDQVAFDRPVTHTTIKNLACIVLLTYSIAWPCLNTIVFFMLFNVLRLCIIIVRASTMCDILKFSPLATNK